MDGPRPDPSGDSALGPQAAALFLIAYLTVAFDPFHLLRPFPGFVASAVLPAFGVAVLAITRPERLGRIPVTFGIVALILWLAMTIAWSVEPGSTAFAVRNELLPLFVACLVVGTMRPRRAVQVLLAFVALVGTWSFLASLALPTAREASIGDGDVLQAGWRGTFQHKNLLGIFAVLSLSLVLCFAPARVRRWAAVSLLVLILATRSATAASGLMLVVVAHVWLRTVGVREPRDRVILKLASVVGVALAVLLVLGLLPTLLSLYAKDVSFSGRTEIWSASWQLIDEQPLHGYGIGAVWSGEGSPLTPELHRRIGFPASHAHNGALNLWLEAGVIGLLAYGAVLGQTLWSAAACRRVPELEPYGRWGISTILGILMMSLSEPLFRGAALGLLVIQSTVLTLARNEHRDRSRDRSAGTVLRPVA